MVQIVSPRTIFSGAPSRSIPPGSNNTLPSARQDLATTTERSSVGFNLIANDLIRDPLRSVTIATNPTRGTVDFTQDSINAAAPTANVLYTPGAALSYLAQGESITDRFTYTVTDVDGDTSTATVLVTITGVNDPVQILGGKTTGGVTEDAATTLRDTGSITFSDLDLSDRHSVTVGPVRVGSDEGSMLEKTVAPTSYGSLTAAVSEILTDQNNQGAVNWTFTAANSAVQSLAAGQTVTQTYALTVADRFGSSASQDVTIFITGVNDAPTLRAATLSGNVIEDAKPAVSGNIGFADPDLIDTHSLAVVPGNGEYLGAFSASIDNQATGDGIGNIAWNFAVDNSSIQYLAQGERLVQTYALTLTDSAGATLARTVTVNITGVNDAPVAADDAASASIGSVITGSVAGNDFDVDNGAVLTYALVGPVAGLTLNADGSYSFDAGNSAYSEIPTGESQTITAFYTVRDQYGATAFAALDLTVNTLINLTDWSTFGSTVSIDGNNLSLTSNSSTNDSQIQTFLGLNRAPDTIGSTDATDGSAALTTVTLGGSAFLKFTWSFTGGDVGSSFYHDFGFVSVDGVDYLLRRYDAGSGSITNQTFSIALGAGTHNIGFAAFDSNDNIAAPTLSITNIRIGGASDPIVLDLDGNGVRFDHVAAFDLDHDGRAETLGWTTDGILALDVNHSGAIENGNEVLSDHFNGGNFADALAALRSLDSNHDGVLNGSDALFNDLLVWRDANSDGVSQSSELVTLTSLGIASLSLATTAEDRIVDGQIIFGSGSFTYANGGTGHFVAADLSSPAPVAGGVSATTTALPATAALIHATGSEWAADIGDHGYVSSSFDIVQPIAQYDHLFL